MRGMPLTDLNLFGTAAERLDPDTLVDPAVFVPVHGMSLTALRLDTEELFWDDDDLKALRGMPLKILNLENGAFSDEGLRSLQGLPITDLDLSLNVEVLELGYDAEITDIGLQVLRGMPLTTLRLARFASITELEFLRGSPLTSLCLEGCDRIISFEGLKGLQLTSLDLSEMRIRDDTLESLRGLSSLTSLKFWGCNGLTGSSFSALEELPLRDLDVDECDDFNPWMLAEFWKARYVATQRLLAE